VGNLKVGKYICLILIVKPAIVLM